MPFSFQIVCGAVLAVRRVGLILALTTGVVLLAAPAYAQTKVWSQGNPTGDEQYALEVINRVRNSPTAAVDAFAAQTTPVTTSLKAFGYYHAGADGLTDLKNTIAATMSAYATNIQNRISGAKPPLALYPAFTEHAKGNVDTVIAAQSVKNSDGSTSTFAGLKLDVDLSRYPTTIPTVPGRLVYVPNALQTPSWAGSNATGGTATIRAGQAENISAKIDGFSRDESLWGVDFYNGDIDLRGQFLTNLTQLPPYFRDSYTWIAPAVPVGTDTSNFNFNYGHDRLIGLYLSDPRAGTVGAGGKTLVAYTTDVEALQNGADLPYGTNTVFVTGVVYTDSNKNGEYNAGEGLAGAKVTVTVNGIVSDWYAVTSTSGGYAVPVQANAGTVVVTISQSGSDYSKATATVNFVSTNATNGAVNATVLADNVKVDFVVPTNKAAQVTIAPSDANAPTLANLSTRGVAEGGANALIGGFVIDGPSSVKKKVLIRAVAYSLGVFQIQTHLAKPVLQLFPGGVTTPIATAHTEDTYQGGVVNPTLAAQMTAVGAFGLKNPDPYGLTAYNTIGAAAGDAVLIVDLAPGSYTAVVSPDPNTDPNARNLLPDGKTTLNGVDKSGVVLLEIYDVSGTADGSTLINLSSRGGVSNALPSYYSIQNNAWLAERQMIVGYVLTGGADGAARRLVVRGVSPSLALVGMNASDLIDDPAMTVYRADGTPEESVDDWGLSSHADQLATLMPSLGAFSLPSNSKDAAVVGRYKAGLHTVISSASGAKQTGVVLDEIYAN